MDRLIVRKVLKKAIIHNELRRYGDHGVEGYDQESR